MPLREFLDRFSLPRVVRLEDTGGRPVLLYKQQQRSLRVTASLLIHRYRHDVKVGPEIVIPEGYPGELFSIRNSDRLMRETMIAPGCIKEIATSRLFDVITLLSHKELYSKKWNARKKL
jgi:hypothetical protein